MTRVKRFPGYVKPALRRSRFWPPDFQKISCPLFEFLDLDPRKARNYVREAVLALLAGKPVAVPETNLTVPVAHLFQLALIKNIKTMTCNNADLDGFPDFQSSNNLDGALKWAYL